MAANQTITQYGITPPKYMQDGATSKRSEVYGLNFPLGSEVNGGFFAKKSGVDKITNSVKQLLQTEKGERIMLPTFGCNLRKFLFQPLDENTFEGIKREILTSFNNYIIGATIQKLSVFPYGDTGPAGGNSLQIILSLKLDTADLEIFDVEVNIS